MTATITPAQFRTLHGDPTTWTVADFDERLDLNDIAFLPTHLPVPATDSPDAA
ncbi:hypothetical protein ACIPW9_36245 [Streptomyces sp. NPDC090052]|uniref:hypothetical protein n=1 Tax=Streptomyces sp. NPDC090052 TaxID=3365931 RepID=UPI0037F504E3